MLTVYIRQASDLTNAVYLLPVTPPDFASIGRFEAHASRTTSVTLDVRHGRFVLVPIRDRRDGATPLAGRGSKWKTQTFQTAHLPLSDVLLPDDVQDLRSFGTEQLSTVDGVLNDRMQDLKDSITATLEYHRTGAVKGVVYDAEGDALPNLFEAAGVTQQNKTITFPATESIQDTPLKKAVPDANDHPNKSLAGPMV